MTKQARDEKILNLQHDLERLKLDVKVHQHQLGRIQHAATRLAKAVKMVAVEKAKVRT